jgi:hypothetical protein
MLDTTYSCKENTLPLPRTQAYPFDNVNAVSKAVGIVPRPRDHRPGSHHLATSQNALASPKAAPYYIPRPEIWINGDESTVFRQMKNVDLRDKVNFGRVPSLALRPSIPSPWLHSSLLPVLGYWGSVLSWQLTFHQVGFSPTGSMNFTRRTHFTTSLAFVCRSAQSTATTAGSAHSLRNRSDSNPAGHDRDDLIIPE